MKPTVFIIPKFHTIAVFLAHGKTTWWPTGFQPQNGQNSILQNARTSKSGQKIRASHSAGSCHPELKRLNQTVMWTFPLETKYVENALLVLFVVFHLYRIYIHHIPPAGWSIVQLSLQGVSEALSAGTLVFRSRFHSCEGRLCGAGLPLLLFPHDAQARDFFHLKIADASS